MHAQSFEGQLKLRQRDQSTRDTSETNFQNMHKKLIVKHGRAATVLGLFFLMSLPVFAAQPIIWEISSRADLLKGDSRGVSISDTGALMLAPLFTQLFNTEQP